MTDNFEIFVSAARLQNEIDEKYRKRTREERKRRLRRRRFVLWLLTLALATAAVFCAMSRVYPEAQAAWEAAVPQSSEEPCGAEYAENPEEEMLIEQALIAKSTKIENCRITYYCAEEYKHICGFGLGITKSGRPLVPNWSCAVDPKVIPLGASVMVDFGDGIIRYFSADDIGGWVKGNHVDICLPTHEECYEQPYNTATVYWYMEEGEA